jgi:hypothetical protein
VTAGGGWSARSRHWAAVGARGGAAAGWMASVEAGGAAGLGAVARVVASGGLAGGRPRGWRGGGLPVGSGSGRGS